MSDMVHYKGKIALIGKLQNETLEEQCKRILIDEHGITEIPEYCDSWEETMRDEMYGVYVIVDNNIYKILSKSAVDVEYHAVAFDNEDGTISYDVSYYDGGCSFDEVIEDALSYKKGFE